MTSLRSLLVGMVSILIASIALAADTTVDPLVGSWLLNLGESKLGSQPVPTNQVRTYTQTPDGLEVIIKGENAVGEADVFESTFKYDGKDYPATGSPDFDTIAVRRLSDLVIHGVLKRDGRIVGHVTLVESKDGQMLTVSERLRGPKGEVLHEVLVYDRQP
jgi:hypothetical protein